LPSSSSSKGKGKTNTIDFGSLIARTTYQPGSTPYDLQLPQDYSASLPARVMEAFKKEKFSWWWKDDGAAAVPEWVPPLDIR
jgi:nucleoporin NUP42